MKMSILTRSVARDLAQDAGTLLLKPSICQSINSMQYGLFIAGLLDHKTYNTVLDVNFERMNKANKQSYEHTRTPEDAEADRQGSAWHRRVDAGRVAAGSDCVQ